MLMIVLETGSVVWWTRRCGQLQVEERRRLALPSAALETGTIPLRFQFTSSDISLYRLRSLPAGLTINLRIIT